MAIIGAGLGVVILSALVKNASVISSRYVIGVGFAAWVSLMLAALACSVELAVSGTIPFSKVIGSMLGTHAFIGIGEGLITAAACFVFVSKPQETLSKRSAVAPLLASGIIAFVLSPFASGLPDGLEWVAQKYQFLHEAAPTFVSPLPGYTVPAISNEMLTTGLAGLAGVIITFAIAWIAARLLNKPGQLETSA